jgi:integrase
MVDVFRARISYKRCKTRHKDRENIIVPMTNKLKEAFRLLPVPFGGEGLLFPALTATQVSRAVGRVFSKCGWERGAAHQLRSAAACYLIRQGFDLTVAQELLGH